jgi:hypothetical protein
MRYLDLVATYRHLTPFARDLVRERATLAVSDPEGEADAMAPLDPDRARLMILALDAAEDDIRPRAYRRPAPLTASPNFLGLDLLNRIGADPNRRRGMVRCPAHEDRHVSLSWRREGDDVLLRCFAGCTFAEILEAVR